MHQLRTLGGVDLRDADGRDIQALLAQPKRLALLVYLALAPAPARHRRRDSVLALFWPDADTEHARASLRQALRYLRRSMGDDIVSARGEEEVGIGAGTLQCDAAMLAEACRARNWHRATELYSGDFLDGFHVAGAAAELDEWIERERSRLRQLACDSAWALADDALAARDGAGAVRWAREGLRLAADGGIAAERLRQVTAQAHALVARDAMPDGIDDAVAKAPAKEPADRYASAGESAAALAAGAHGSPSEGSSSKVGVAPRARSWRWPALVFVGAVAATTAAALSRRAPPPPAPPRRQQITYSGDASAPALAPDLRTIAFVKGLCQFSHTCSHELVVQDVTGGHTVLLARGAQIHHPKWHPGGISVLFLASSVSGAADTTGGAYLVPRFGGTLRRIGSGDAAAFSANGDALVLARSAMRDTVTLRYIRSADLEVLDSASVPFLHGGLSDLDWSPDGKWLALLLYRGQGDRRLVLVSRRHGTVTDSMKVPGRQLARWLPGGDAVLLLLQGGSSDDVVSRVGVDRRTGRFTSDTVAKLRIPAGGSTFDLSRDGTTLAFVDAASTTTELITMQRDAGRVTARSRLTFTGWRSRAELSPDGGTVALARADAQGGNMYLIPFDSAAERPVTFTGDHVDAPVWLRDGRLVFKKGLPSPGLFVLNPTGGRPRPFGPAGYATGDPWYLQWLDDSLYVLDQRDLHRVFVLDSSGSIRHMVTVPDTLNQLLTVTPDARELWFFDRDLEKGRFYSLDRVTGAVKVAFDFPLTSNGGVVGWANGAYVFATWPKRTASAPTIWRVNSDGTTTRIVRLPADCDFRSLTMSRDGRRFVCTKTDTKRDIWLLHGLALRR